MDYQEKASALDSLSELKILIRGPLDWYVSQSVEVKRMGSCMLAGMYGNGETPEEAILDHWKVLVDDLTPGDFLVINAGDPKRRRDVYWHRYMWKDA
jgi:hypothetical protein